MWKRWFRWLEKPDTYIDITVDTTLFAQQPICHINNFNTLILIFGISRSRYHHFRIGIFYFEKRLYWKLS